MPTINNDYVLFISPYYLTTAIRFAAGKDLMAVNETVVFTAGSNRTFIIILILDDKIGFEENQHFLIQLTTFESGVEAVPNGNPTTVTIVDNDSKYNGSKMSVLMLRL